MSLSALLSLHPELQGAVSESLRAVALERPFDPYSRLAEKLLEYDASRGAPSSSSVSSSASSATSSASEKSSSGNSAAPGKGGSTDEAAAAAGEDPKLAALKARGKNRRAVVFSEAVTLDKEFKARVIPKTSEQEEEITNVIAKNALFLGMDVDARRTIVGAMEQKHFSPGDTIIRQGDPGDFFYVLSHGLCDIFVNGNKVGETSKGKSFGELALLYDAPRAATIIASSACDQVRTWAVDRVTFKQVMMGTTIRKREMYEAFLKERVPLFADFSSDEILAIADALSPISFAAGEVAIREGDLEADAFLLVETGELAVGGGGGGGGPTPPLLPGDYFGEKELINGEPRACTVTAVIPTTCLSMDKNSFIRLLAQIDFSKKVKA